VQIVLVPVEDTKLMELNACAGPASSKATSIEARAVKNGVIFFMASPFN
jgi:hypothetical protein